MPSFSINLVVAVTSLVGIAICVWRYLRRRRIEHISNPLTEHVPAMTARSDGGWLFGRLTPVLASMLPQREDKRQALAKELINAGYYHPSAPDNLAAVRYLGIILPIVVFGALLLMAPTAAEVPLVVAGIVLSILGWALPALIVRRRAAGRRDEMTRAMPDMLDMLNMCVSQGMTLTSSLSRIIRELRPVYPALAHELQIVTDQARIGSVEQALENFARRVDVPEVHSFTSMLIQTEQMGTSVSAALADHSDNIRESRKQRADQAANTAVLKMLFPTALCLMPAVFLFLLGPAVVDLSDFFGGKSGEVFRAGRDTATEVLNDGRINP